MQSGSNPPTQSAPAANCCDAPEVAVVECYSYPKTCLQMTNYSTACGCCGETYILADLSGGGKPKKCTSLEILGDPKGGGFVLDITIGCDKHQISVCKLPADAAVWESFVYSALATDAFLLTNNVSIAIVKSGNFGLTLSLCAECDLAIVPSIPKGSTTEVTTAPVANVSTAPKLGQFVSYSVSGGNLSGIETYGGDLYAGYLMLPDSIPTTACCVPESCGCNAVGQCRKILRTGKARVPLAVPFPMPSAGNAQLATKPDGSIVAFFGTKAPAGATVFPFPHSIVMDPSTIGSSLITVVFH